MKESKWVVTFHFDRGSVLTTEYTNKQDAWDAVRICVFNNEDCVTCSVYRVDSDLSLTIQEQTRTRLNLQKG